MSRVSTPYSSWSSGNKSYREFPSPISALCDLTQSDDVEFFAGRPERLNHFDLNQLISSIDSVAQKAQSAGAEVQNFLKSNNLQPAPVSAQETFAQQTQALQTQAKNSPLIIGAVAVVAIILAIKFIF